MFYWKTRQKYWKTYIFVLHFQYLCPKNIKIFLSCFSVKYLNNLKSRYIYFRNKLHTINSKDSSFLKNFSFWMKFIFLTHWQMFFLFYAQIHFILISFQETRLNTLSTFACQVNISWFKNVWIFVLQNKTKIPSTIFNFFSAVWFICIELIELSAII